MRKLFVAIAAALAVAAFPVHADRGGSRHGGHHHGGGSGWAGLAVFGALTGMAILAERSRPVYVDPYYVGPIYPQQPVYVEQLPAIAPPARAAGTWYYCGSSAMYYPYTLACPEGWQAVPARPY